MNEGIDFIYVEIPIGSCVVRDGTDTGLNKSDRLVYQQTDGS